VVLDVDVGPTGGSIIDGAYLVPLVNGCKGAWTKVFFSATASKGCLLFGERAFYHVELGLLYEGSSDLTGEVLDGGVVLKSNRFL